MSASAAGLRPAGFARTLGALVLVLLATVAIGLLVGPRSLPGVESVDGIGGFGRILERGLFESLRRVEAGEATTEELVLLRVRPLRVALALVAGAALATAGVGFQAILRNPLADPYVLGVSGGASLAVAISFVGVPASLLALLGAGPDLPPVLRPLFAFAGAAGATGLVLLAARGFAAWSGERLILVGVIANAIFSAAILVVTVMVPFGRLPGLAFWLMGVIDDKRVGAEVVLIALALSAVAGGLLLVRARELNALAFGESTAFAVGVDPLRARRRAFLAAAMLTAAAVSLAGPVGFVGLIVPHALRLLLGPDHRLLLPAAFVGGGAFLVLADTLARTAVVGREVPVGAVTALIGGPVFLLLLARSRYGQGLDP